jgi:F420-dependent oxidoreductase-like protein
MSRPTFGVFVPQGWKMELASIPDPSAKWEKALEIAVLAEELGFDSLWVYDHFHNVPRPAHEAVFECWTTIAALSQRTTTIRLGQMVGCNSYRNPALLAKITSTVDVISGGRLDWGIGAGWYDQEYRGYGYEFPSAKVRIQMLREAVEIVKAMWTQPDVTYEGRHYKLEGAQCDPKPIQQPHPPIWIGGGGEQLTLRVVARHATHSNFGGKPHEWSHKRDVLRRHCDEVGRDPDEITMTWSPGALVRESAADLPDAIERFRPSWESPDSWVDGNLVGTPDEVVDKIGRYQELGCGGIVAWPNDLPDTETLRLLGEKVLPQLT